MRDDTTFHGIAKAMDDLVDEALRDTPGVDSGTNVGRLHMASAVGAGIVISTRDIKFGTTVKFVQPPKVPDESRNKGLTDADIDGMLVPALKEALTARGQSAQGLKKELVRRLKETCEHERKGGSDQEDNSDQQDDSDQEDDIGPTQDGADVPARRPDDGIMEDSGTGVDPGEDSPGSAVPKYEGIAAESLDSRIDRLGDTSPAEGVGSLSGSMGQLSPQELERAHQFVDWVDKQNDKDKPCAGYKQRGAPSRGVTFQSGTQIDRRVYAAHLMIQSRDTLGPRPTQIASVEKLPRHTLEACWRRFHPDTPENQMPTEMASLRAGVLSLLSRARMMQSSPQFEHTKATLRVGLSKPLRRPVVFGPDRPLPQKLTDPPPASVTATDHTHTHHHTTPPPHQPTPYHTTPRHATPHSTTPHRTRRRWTMLPDGSWSVTVNTTPIAPLLAERLGARLQDQTARWEWHTLGGHPLFLGGWEIWETALKYLDWEDPLHANLRESRRLSFKPPGTKVVAQGPTEAKFQTQKQGPAL